MPSVQTESPVTASQMGIAQHPVLTTAQECSCVHAFLSQCLVDDRKVLELGAMGNVYEPQIA